MRFIAALLLFVTPALAQEQIASPSQLAIQIDNAIGVLAQRAERAEAQARQLQAQIANLQKQLEALKSNEPKK